ncbi:YphA family membrane protein [Paenibacillus naphthalenovorans]|uniref:YphA family membrane protein n=1 Tax=Paenibacillus naphthalenovorans TaxID=162209 RepID=UPI003D2C809A
MESHTKVKSWVFTFGVVQMNAGYLSLLLIVVSLILFASGWKEIILRGITHLSLLLFFIAWLLLLGWSFTLDQWRIFGCVPLLLAVSFLVIMRTRGMLMRFHLFSVGLLLGSVFFFLKETIHLMPAMIILNPEWTMAIINGLLVSALVRWPAFQVAALSLGLLIGEGMYAYSHREQTDMVIGHAGFQDVWWLTLYAARGSSLVLESAAAGCKKAYYYVWNAIRERKE